MTIRTTETSSPPYNAKALGLKLSFPLSCLSSIERGFESQSQDDKWSIYYRKPWIQIWRPDDSGDYCYGIRLATTDKHRLSVDESWVGSCILEGLGSDLKQHQEIVTWLLDFVADFHGYHFESPVVSGTRQRGKVTFSGTAKSVEDVDEIAKKIRSEFAEMQKDAW
jgi:hypothetical protein